MVTLSKISKYTKAGILMLILGLLILGVEDILWDESIRIILYLLPIGCFFSSFIAFTKAGISADKKMK